MITKHIVVLAKSYKNEAWCVAGRELDADGQPLDNWIRPVSNSEYGALTGAHCLSHKRPVRVLDIVSIPMLGPKPGISQPENWLFDESQMWTIKGACSREALPVLLETPRNLWLERSGRQDRISVEAQAMQSPQFSLTLVRPVDFKLRLSVVKNPYNDGREEKKARAVFRYCGIRYELSVTDPVFREKYCVGYPPLGAKPIEKELPFKDNCCLCVSLTPPFKGAHYKVVAAVLELT
jgi:hypothetical protein